MSRKFERDACNAAHFLTRVDFSVERLRFLDAARRTKIDSAEQLANDHEIDAANGVTPKGRAIDQSFENGNGPEVRVIAEQLPQIEQTVFALLARRQVIVLRIADGAEENGIRFQADVLCGFGQRLTMTLNSDAADVGLYEFEFVVVLARDDFQNPASFSEHLRADAITRQPRYARFHGLKSSPDRQLSSCGRPARGTSRTPYRSAREKACSRVPDSAPPARDVPNACPARSCCAARPHVPAT